MCAFSYLFGCCTNPLGNLCMNELVENNIGYKEILQYFETSLSEIIIELYIQLTIDTFTINV